MKSVLPQIIEKVILEEENNLFQYSTPQKIKTGSTGGRFENYSKDVVYKKRYKAIIKED